MRTIDHPHILRAIAAFTKGEQCGFIMPRARGSLRSFCETQDNSTYQSETILSWLFTQLLGVTDGLARLHGDKYGIKPSTCHGALTPDNILWFSDHKSGPDADSLGVLVIGGRRDLEPRRYVVRERPQSPLDDTWSLGLIIFELVIWLLRGNAEVQEFRSQTSRVCASDEDDCRFEEWSGLLTSDGRCLPGTPLGGLVQFIVRRLLVPRGGPSGAEGRATASQLHGWLSLVRSVVAESGSPYTAVQQNLPELQRPRSYKRARTLASPKRES